MQILLVEDNVELSHALIILLEAAGYQVTLAETGEDGLYLIEDGFYDLVILDRMLPEIDGLSLLKKVRRQGNATPVLMMTAMGQISDKVDGLESGADDYIVKPFDDREFLARIKALLRRPENMVLDDRRSFLDTTLDTVNMTLAGALGETTLSLKETSLLRLFFDQPGQLITREALFGKVWGYETDVDYSSLDSYIYYVRRRLKAVSDRVMIKTLPKKGYRLEEKDGKQA